MFDRERRAVRLGYLVGRAIVHIFATAKRPGTYCIECNSVMAVATTGEVSILATGKPCPVHVAWRELLRVGMPPARSTR
ncbi:MAG TPA: hypothetical protein VJZ73_13270 [Methylomirabilota bacterium]|nr:hypothetical protein [Methylomirabilota bacterium]